MQRANDRNYNLDLMRILACISVVGLHTLQKDLSVINSFMYYICGFAIPVFFVASGYILLSREQATVRYSMEKVTKIILRVISWSTIYFVAKFMIDFIGQDLEKYTIWSLPKLISGNLIQRGSLGHLWYLGALAIIYILFPMLSRIKKNLCCVWIIAFMIGCMMQIQSYIVGKPMQSYCIQTFRIWTWMQYFILGGLYGGGGKVLRKIRKHFSTCAKFNCA